MEAKTAPEYPRSPSRQIDALLCQHGGVHAAAAHILRDHALVEADGRVEVVDAGIDRLGETALPKLFCHC